MNRKEFFAKVGFGAAAVLVPACLTGITTSCSSSDPASTTPAAGAPSTSSPVNIDFTVETASGALAANGGFVVSNGVVVARTLTGSFIAVAAACTHQQTTVSYVSSSNSFSCSSHGSKFSATGEVTNGPAVTNLKQYQTALTGTSLRVFS